MAFGKKKQPVRPLTTEELIAAHRRLAQEHLDRAAKAGRLEAETRHATAATGHAVMALSYQIDLLAARFDVAPVGPVAPGDDGDGYDPITPE